MRKLVSFIILISICSLAISQVRLPTLISDGMVMQRHTKLQLWGWASAAEKVTLVFKGKKYITKAGQQGRWAILLPAQEAGGPYSLHVRAGNEIVINNILIGDVWLCSGQSNMELTLERLKYNYAEEIRNGDNPAIRQFTVPDRYDFKRPQEDLAGGQWLPATGHDLLGFSAVGWFFAKELYKKYKVPVGLINAALGGSPAEAWISEEAIRKFPEYYIEAQRFKSDALIDSIEMADRQISRDWYEALNEKDEGLKNSWINPGYDDAGWTAFSVPGYWPDTGNRMSNGSAWFRREMDVPASMVGLPAKLELGRIVDADSVFINGKFVGATGYQYPPRRYELSPGTLREGNNVLVIRMISNSGNAGFVPGKRYELTTLQDTIDLNGNWKYHTGSEMPPLPGQTFIRWKPVGLYNAMIAPLVRYSIRGVIWYQGESNAAKPGNYKTLMQTLIADWRGKWKQARLPFIYVQLANFMEAKQTPAESSWAELRQQQLDLLTVPNTAMAVAIDLGEWNDIHPENKRDVGLRLARHAEHLVYGDTKLIASGPLYQSLAVDGNRIILSFSNCGTGLIARGDTVLNQFAVAGKDGRYEWAKAIIKGNKVIVWNDSISNPAFVRYAWADNPAGANLYNRAGLPASPFSVTIAARAKHPIQ